MATRTDIRLPVRFGPLTSLRPHEALLLPEGAAAAVPAGLAVGRFAPAVSRAAHPAACPCCMPRGPLAAVLTRLFLARIRGDVPFFAGLLVADADRETELAIRELLRRDPFIGSRYRAGFSAAPP